jgi:hypothetical protein
MTGSWRQRKLAQLRRELETEASPRFTLLLVVLLTGIAAFIASALMLSAGLGHMWLRYPLTVAVAYGVFLALMWAWLRWRRDDGDVPDLSGSEQFSGGRGDPSAAVVEGHGGEFAGAGSGDSFDGGLVHGAVSAKAETAGSIAEGAAGAALEGCGVVVLVVLAVMLASGLFAWVASTAPGFLAEFVLDGFLAAALYRRLRRDGPHWVHAVLRRTRAPFLAVTLASGLFGAAFELYAPEAVSIIHVWHHFWERQ